MTYTATTRLIADAIDGCGKTQRQIAEEIDHERPNVISMMRTKVDPISRTGLRRC